MVKKPKVQAEIVSNPQCRLFHFNFKLTDECLGKILRGGMTSNELKALNKADDATKKLVIGVDGIDGIETFSLTSYQLQIIKAPLFEWEEIEPQVIGLVRMVGQELLGEEVEYIEKPIWGSSKWGYDEDGTGSRRRRDISEDIFD